MLARLRAGVLHDRVGVSRSRAGVDDPRCNIVHIERGLSSSLREAGRRAARDWLAAGDDDDGPQRRRRPHQQPQQHARASAVLRVEDAREDALRERLVPDWMARQYPELAAAIAEDAAVLARMVAEATAAAAAADPATRSSSSSSSPAAVVSARLEALSWQPCPKWHADTVGARGIVTYAGGAAGGTQFLPNSRVSRSWGGWGAFAGAGAPAAPSVARVRPPAPGEAPFEAAGLGDLLLLKGHDCPGLMGMGAVHRSPPIREKGGGGKEEEDEVEDDEGEARLVLTIDDALPCDCCAEVEEGAGVALPVAAALGRQEAAR